MIEVELKCELPSEAQQRLREKLQKKTFQGVVQYSDVYYDTSEWDLLQQAVFVRVRDNRHLQFKFNEQRDSAHVQSVEKVFPLVPDRTQAAEMNTLFARFLSEWHVESDFETARMTNGLIELVRINNRRELYTLGDMHISIDHVESLGDFLEAEIQCEDDSDTGRALARLQTFISELGLRPIHVGYVEMWLRTHNPQMYQLGKYHL